MYLEGTLIVFFGSVINQFDLPGGYMNSVLWLSHQPVWSTWRVYELRSLAQSSTSVIYLEGTWIVLFGSVFNLCDLPGGYMNCVIWLSRQPVWSTWRVYELCFDSVFNQCDLPGGYMNCVFGSVINQCDQPGGYMNCVIWLSHQPVWSTWRVYELCYLAQSTTSVIYLEGIWIALFGSVINQCDLPRGYMNCVIWLSHQPVWSTWRVYELRSLAQSSTSVIYLEGIWIAFFGSVFNQCDLSGGYRNCVLWFSHQPVWST